MDLKEAIFFLEKQQPIPSDVHATVLQAAKRDLARQEAERPKRASLEDLEGNLRDICAGDYGSLVGESADVLKALREVVVPWLRLGGEGGKRMLIAIGEDP